MERNRTQRARTAAALLAMLVATGGSVAHSGIDLPRQDGAAERAVPPLTGRTFAGLTIGAGVQPGGVRLRASRALTWTEAPEDPASQPTRRLLLTGDAGIELGVYRFSAVGAAVWIEQIGVAEHDPSIPVYQVAAYLDRVGDPAAKSGISASGDRLLVTGIVAGDVVLAADLLRQERADDPLVVEGEARLARLLREVAGVAEDAGPVPPAREPFDPQAPIRPGAARPFEPESPLATGERVTGEGTRLPPRAPGEPIFGEGRITFAPDPVHGNAVLAGGQEGGEGALIFTGGLVVQYVNPGQGEMVEIVAERGVAFLRVGDTAQLVTNPNVEDVIGLYLEGNVVATRRDPNQGEYTLRAPRIYYDVQNQRALAVEAVFWTYDEQVGMPLYVRAKAMRQEGENQFSARGATLSNSRFFEPTFSIGASEITVTHVPGERGKQDSTLVRADDVTFRFGSLPFFYWPRFAGDVESMPLRAVALENSSNSGLALRTTWDPFALLGVQAPEGIDARLLVDGYFERGAALGGSVHWLREDSRGAFFGYTLIEDDGTDELSSGAEINRENDTRSLLLGEHLWKIDERWSLQLEGAYVSDETFVDAFFRDMARNRREFTNAAYLRRLDEQSSLWVLAQANVMDFTPNQYLLQSQGYDVDRLPEVGYARVADDLFGKVPGLLTWTHEYRLSRLAFNFTEPTARQLGYDTDQRALDAFGILPDERLSDRLRAAGLTQEPVTRFDTRHEVSITADFGPLKFVPFAVGRFTAYDKGFEDFNGDDDDRTRVWAGGGVRISTSIERIDDSVDSGFFDLHRIRHIVEPSVTVWAAGSNLDQTELPVYDESVESLATGAAVRAGVKQTWQTKRGGPGRWRTVDVLTLNLDYVSSSGDSDRESPIPRFVEYRPEYSLLGGDFFTADLRWQITDAVGFVFNTVYDFEINQPARTVVGGTFEHSPDFRTFTELRYINARDITYIDVGAAARLSRKYSADGYATYDTDAGEFRAYGGTVRRRFQALTLGLSMDYDNLTDDLSVSLVLEPLGTTERPVRLQRLQR